MKKEKNNTAKKNYKKQVDVVKKAITDYYASKENSLLKKANLGSFFKFVNNRLNSRTKILNIIHNNCIVSENMDIANVFNTYFASVFSTDNNYLDHIVPNKVAKCPYSSFDPMIVLETLNKLKPTFSVGPDGLCSYFIKKLKGILCFPLSTIFEVSYRTSKLLLN